VVKIKLRYYVVKNGRAYFHPTTKMKAAGFQNRPLGADGPAAWAEAQRLYEDWLRHRKGLPPLASAEKRPQWPDGAVGFAFERYRRTEAWAAKAEATRKKDWEWSWRFIAPVFGDVAPATIQVEDIEGLYAVVKAQRGLHTAHRVIKTWRALWKVMAAMGYCGAAADPSGLLRNTAPKGRSETWAPGEIARIAKAAWRHGYRGLAAILAVAWDTQFAPVDCRTLTPAQRRQDRQGVYFVTNRGKTGRAVIGTLSRRGQRVVEAYLARLGVAIPAEAPLFRNRSGHVYTPDTLGDDFRDMREIVFPGDTRKLIDIRRTGTVEAIAGKAEPAAMAQKMGNSIDKNRQLQETYMPARAATVRQVDEARKRGRKVLRENEG